jgi:hypothetical protein
VKVNEQISTPTSLTVRALHISTLNSATNAPLIDVIIGEAKRAFDPDVCNPDKQFIIPPASRAPAAAPATTTGAPTAATTTATSARAAGRPPPAAA